MSIEDLRTELDEEDNINSIEDNQENESQENCSRFVHFHPNFLD